MTLLPPKAFRAAAVGAVSCAVLLGGEAIAAADPPPTCDAANLARISSGVSNATADYLVAHPDVNAFFTGLKGQDTETMRGNVEKYLNSNPQVKEELQGIRQPLVDFKARCK